MVKITIEGNVKEIAALALAVQERQKVVNIKPVGSDSDIIGQNTVTVFDMKNAIER